MGVSQKVLGKSPGHEPLQELQASLLGILLGLANAVLAPVVDLLVHSLILRVLVCFYAGKVDAWEVLPRDVKWPPAVAWAGACNARSCSDSGPPNNMQATSLPRDVRGPPASALLLGLDFPHAPGLAPPLQEDIARDHAWWGCCQSIACRDASFSAVLAPEWKARSACISKNMWGLRRAAGNHPCAPAQAPLRERAGLLAEQ